MRFNRIIMATVLLLVILTMGAVSASENINGDDSSDMSVLENDYDFDEDEFDEDEFDDYEDEDEDDFDEEPEDLYVHSDVEYEKIYYADANTVITYLGELPSNAKGTFSIYEYDDLLATKTVVNGNARFILSDLRFTSDILGEHNFNVIYDDGLNKYEKILELEIVDYKISGPEEIHFGETAVYSITMNSAVNGRVEVYLDEEKIGFGDVINGIGTVRLSGLSLGYYEIEFMYLEEDMDEFYFLSVSPKKITVKSTAYIGADNFFSVTLPNDASGVLTVEVKNVKTGKVIELESKYSKGNVAMPASKLPVGEYVITDFSIEDKNYGEYYFVDLPTYDDGAVFAKFKVVYPKFTLSKVKTLKRTKNSLTLKATLGKVNGKYLAKKLITFKFNTKTYKVYTNKYGVAKIIVGKSVYKNFKVGKIVSYKATYLKKTVAGTLKILK